MFWILHHFCICSCSPPNEAVGPGRPSYKGDQNVQGDSLGFISLSWIGENNKSVLCSNFYKSIYFKWDYLHTNTLKDAVIFSEEVSQCSPSPQILSMGHAWSDLIMVLSLQWSYWESTRYLKPRMSERKAGTQSNHKPLLVVWCIINWCLKFSKHIWESAGSSQKYVVSAARGQEKGWKHCVSLSVVFEELCSEINWIGNCGLICSKELRLHYDHSRIAAKVCFLLIQHELYVECVSVFVLQKGQPVQQECLLLRNWQWSNRIGPIAITSLLSFVFHVKRFFHRSKYIFKKWWIIEWYSGVVIGTVTSEQEFWMEDYSIIMEPWRRMPCHLLPEASP